MIKNKIKALFNPSHYHGWSKSKSYFEGWYYKLVSKDEKSAFAIIPGIAMDNNGKKQAFIQVLDGKNLSAVYHKFNAKAFKPSSHKFEVNIQENFFSLDSLKVNLPNFTADLSFSNMVPWPSRWYSPGIMGPFSFVPFMQCYHGILSMNHLITGSIISNGVNVDFSGGKGYAEKDWGSSFPSAYIWMQSNHFEKEGVSFKASIAKIPFAGTSFVGFIAGLHLDGKIIQFTTYNFSKLKKSYVDEDLVEIVIGNPKHKLVVIAQREEATSLASPILGFMDGRIEESMTSTLSVELSDSKTGEIIFKGEGKNAGLEVAGKTKEILV